MQNTIHEQHAALQIAHSKLKNAHEELQAQNAKVISENQKLVAENKALHAKRPSQLGVILTTGEPRFYDADNHTITPSLLEPKVVQFWKVVDKKKNAKRLVASVPWNQVREVVNPSA